MDDVHLLFDYVPGKSVALTETAEPDVNGDGKVNNRDAMLLFRKLTQ
jgi:hypothetical protein